MHLEKGATIEGKVTGITKYGAFVKLDDGTNGMIHISEISSEFVKDVNEHLKLNQTVKAVVIAVDTNGKVSLSMKQIAGEKKPPVRNNTERYVKDGSVGNSFRSPNRQYQNSKSPEEYSKRNNKSAAPGSFEDMMSKFKHDSEEKISNLKNFEPKKNSFARRKNYQNNRDD